MNQIIYDTAVGLVGCFFLIRYGWGKVKKSRQKTLELAQNIKKETDLVRDKHRKLFQKKIGYSYGARVRLKELWGKPGHKYHPEGVYTAMWADDNGVTAFSITLDDQEIPPMKVSIHGWNDVFEFI